MQPIEQILESHGVVLQSHTEALDKIQKDTADGLFFRKVATGAAIAGALFAAVRLTDIYMAVKDRRRRNPAGSTPYAVIAAGLGAGAFFYLTRGRG